MENESFDHQTVAAPSGTTVVAQAGGDDLPLTRLRLRLPGGTEVVLDERAPDMARHFNAARVKARLEAEGATMLAEVRQSDGFVLTYRQGPKYTVQAVRGGRPGIECSADLSDETAARTAHRVCASLWDQ
jgi:hypothetical protein